MHVDLEVLSMMRLELFNVIHRWEKAGISKERIIEKIDGFAVELTSNKYKLKKLIPDDVAEFLEKHFTQDTTGEVHEQTNNNLE